MDFSSRLQQAKTPPLDEQVPPLLALKNLNETVTEALLACLKDQPEQVGQSLMKALPQLLLAMAVMGVDPVQALRHQSDPESDSQRLIYVEGNRVEVRVNDELRGSWSIWSIADLKEVCRLAEEFDCDLVYSLKGDTNYETQPLSTPVSDPVSDKIDHLFSPLPHPTPIA